MYRPISDCQCIISSCLHLLSSMHPLLALPISLYVSMWPFEQALPFSLLATIVGDKIPFYRPDITHKEEKSHLPKQFDGNTKKKTTPGWFMNSGGVWERVQEVVESIIGLFLCHVRNTNTKINCKRPPLACPIVILKILIQMWIARISRALSQQHRRKWCNYVIWTVPTTESTKAPCMVTINYFSQPLKQ